MPFNEASQSELEQLDLEIARVRVSLAALVKKADELHSQSEVIAGNAEYNRSNRNAEIRDNHERSIKPLKEEEARLRGEIFAEGPTLRALRCGTPCDPFSNDKRTITANRLHSN